MEFLLENKKEVMDMSVFEFNQEMFIKVQTDEARADGRAEGRAEGEQRMGALNKYLISDHRYDDLERVADDVAYRKMLFQQYGIA